MDNRFSQLLSYILHPLLIPLLATLAIMMRPDLYNIVLPDRLKFSFVSLVIVFTLVIPVVAVLLLKKFRAIDSIEMKNRNERTIPLLITATSYMVLLFFMKPANIPPLILYVLYSATFALLAGLIINLVYKISLHTLGWSALAATLASISLRFGTPLLLLIIISVIVAGFAGYARINQKAHNQAEVYLGYVAGLGIIALLSILH